MKGDTWRPNPDGMGYVVEKKMELITRKLMDELEKAGHVVHEYPRKKVVCVDGYKYYRIAPPNQEGIEDE